MNPPDLTNSWQLIAQTDAAPLKGGFLGGLYSVIATDENRVRLCLPLVHSMLQTDTHV